jgi:hypothetical protein
MAKMAQMMKQVSLSTIRDQQRPNGLLRRNSARNIHMDTTASLPG